MSEAKRDSRSRAKQATANRSTRRHHHASVVCRLGNVAITRARSNLERRSFLAILFGNVTRELYYCSTFAKGNSVKIIVDLIRCQGYAQCVFAAPTVFRLHGDEALEFDYAPDDAVRAEVLRAVAACPVHAIQIGWSEDDREVSGDA
jgi:ferredoxin